ncbi:MAG: extracellular solute-binding protein [Candidatus Promineifilaceae bacterium]|nr:extracellular solute-binding protein [Candidatus Promineifilaceae bacterium]
MLKRMMWPLLLILLVALVACGGQTAEEILEEETDVVEEDDAVDTAEEAEEEAQEVAEEEAEEVAAACPGDVDELTILWAQWDPADYLQQIGNMYEQETGVAVEVVQEPWGSFGDLFFTEMAAQGTSYDMVVGDSQWLGQSVTQGHYLDLTEFMVEGELAETVTPATLTYYAEYPTGSEQYWAFPTEGDANGWAYRADLFEDPDEQAAFEEEYGYPLAPPETWEQLVDMAHFFTRPDEGLWGAAIYTQADYDAITMGFQNTLFSYGADWASPDNDPRGVINSEDAVNALETYRELYECCQPPGMSNAFFSEVNDAFISGQAAMAMNYFAFFPALINPDINPYAETTGFFVNPEGPTGAQHAALGGQGMSVISYISPERQEASLCFIDWFAQPEIQTEWAALGGFTTNQEVLESEFFLNQTPFNPAFAETMTIVKDFWNIPVFGELLVISQRELGEYIVEGQGTAEEALNAIAEEHYQILQDADMIEE